MKLRNEAVLFKYASMWSSTRDSALHRVLLPIRIFGFCPISLHCHFYGRLLRGAASNYPTRLLISKGGYTAHARSRLTLNPSKILPLSTSLCIGSHHKTHQILNPAVLYWGTPVVIISFTNPDGTTNIAPMSSAFSQGTAVYLV